jgi:hypothetical protein
LTDYSAIQYLMLLCVAVLWRFVVVDLTLAIFMIYVHITYINLGIWNFDTKIDIWHLYAEAPVEVVLCVLVFWFIVASL